MSNARGMNFCFYRKGRFLSPQPKGSVGHGLFSISLGILFLIIARLGKQDKVNLELIERIQKLETKNSNES